MSARAGHRWRKFSTRLALIAAAGLLARVIYVVWMRNRIVSGDGVAYHFGALQLVDGDGFVNPLILALTGERVPDAVHPPAWMLLLTGPSALGLRSWLSHQLVAALVGTAAIVMTGVAGREAFGRRTGLIAAALVAVYPNAWLYERELLAEPLAMLGVATTIWLAYRFRATPSWPLALALGLSVGVMALTRAELIAISVLLVVPLIVTAGGRDRLVPISFQTRFAWLTLAGIGCVVLIAPWAIYNSTRFDRPVPLSHGAGAAMLQGNCEQVYHGDRLGYGEFGCLAFVRNLSDDPSVADDQYREAAFDFIHENRRRAPVVVAARVGRVFGVYRPFQQMHLETGKGTELWVLRLAFFSYWLLLPLAVAGAVAARRREIPIYPLLVFFVTVLLSALLTIGTVRYRAPAEIPLVLLAAFALDIAIVKLRSRSVHRSATPPAV